MTFYLFERLVWFAVWGAVAITERFSDEPRPVMQGLAIVVVLWAVGTAQAEARRIWPKGGPS